MGLTAPGAVVPPRLQRALDAFAGLQDDGLYLVPVRHHSPACALAVAALVREVRPAAVLIEGPEEYTPLVAALQDPATVPPVAVLSIARTGESTSSAFYPLAEFSPEWVALRAAGEAGVPVAFIDRPWAAAEHPDEEHLTRTLQAERYLADSRTLAEIARREHCRDHDELWDQLVELRPREDLADWRRTCRDVLVWSALARLDYEPEVLAAEGSLDREARMAARVREWRARVDGPVVVVTGGFHTLALVEALTGAPEGDPVRALEPAGGYGPPATQNTAAWLIRYDFARLDALRGYGAGMPSPGFHQRMWQWLTAAEGPEQVTAEILVDVARRVHAAGAYDRTGTAATGAALEQATRLAHLRGHPWPGRTDVLDAITSCFVDDSGPDAALREAVDRAFCGHALGEVPPGTAAPPIVAEARRTAERLRLVVTDSLPRTTTTDPVRSPGQRERSRFLALMEFLGTGFSRRVGGPDLVRGQGLGLLQEQWQYAWTPMVEAALIDLAQHGGTLLDVAEARIVAAEHALDASPERRSAAGAVQVLAQAAVVGLGSRLRPLVDLVGSHLDVDPSLGSVVGAAHRTLALWRARASLDVDDAIGDSLLQLLHQAVPAAAYLVLGGARPGPDDEERAVATLVAVHDLLRDLQHQLDVTALERALDRARLDPDTSPGVRGALVALGVVDGAVGDDELSAQLVAHLGTGADVEVSVRFLAGVMAAAPDLLLHTPALVDAVGAALTRMSDEAFLAALPELRRSFARLRPTETAQLAEHVAGPAGGLVDVRHTDLTEADLAEGVALERQLSRSLADESLLALGARPGALVSDETARRWRLVLGRYADGRLPADQVLGGQDSLLEETLGYLFDREYTQRGDRLAGRGSGGTLDPTALTAITWLARARELFPASTVERLQAQAIERYGLTDLLADEDTARTLDPSPQLATALLSVRGTLDAQLEAGMRTVIARVVDEIVQRLRPRFTAARSGRRNRFRRSPHAVAQNLDWRRTIGANLRHYDTSSGTLVIDRPWFVSRTRRHVPWDVVLCVDQSGSMAASVLYSAVCASILAGLPGVTVRLVLFDTSVVDMSHLAADPVTLLMRAQLGGGTDIAGAMRYCETLVTAPARTVVVLVSDFEEGGSVSSLLRTVTRLRTAGVRLLGLAALDEDARPVYDARVAGLLADRGMEIAALTPDRFAEWLAEVMP